MIAIKKIYNLLLILFLIPVLFGCEIKQAKSQGSFTDISYEELVKKIDNKDSFILQFSKTACPYCQELEEVESEYFIKNNEIIYRFYIDLNELDYDENIDFFKSKFNDLSFVPTVYWMEEGVAKNQLPILENNQYDILDKWINDNKKFYQ